MDLYKRNGNILYILNVLKKYTDADHILSISMLKEKIKEEYDQDIDSRTIRRIINLLKEEFGYDISTYNDNNKGYYISNDPETDFEPGEIRAIIDTFSYSSFIEKNLANGIINKCRKLQNVYENEKIKNYKVYSPKGTTNNAEVIKNIEDISNSIVNKNKIYFEYWKYCIVGDKIQKEIVSKPVVSPYAIVYDKQQLYMIGIKEGNTDFFHYRLDRIKNLKELPDKVTIKKTDKDIEKYALSSVEVFSGNEVDIEAICHKDLLEEAIEKFEKSASIKPIDSDHFNLKLRANPIGFQLWAMRNLDLVTIKKPESLVTRIKEIIKDAEKRYN